MGDFVQAPWWLIGLAVIGVAALVTAVLSLFSSIGDRPGTASTTAVPEVGGEDFLQALVAATNSPLQEGGTARLLNNGDEFLPAMLGSLREARESINFMTYIWEPGELSDRVFDVLVERARAGVQVRVLVDGLAGRKAPPERIEELRRAGGRWVRFRPLRFGQLTRFHKRNHRRAIVVDGKVGYTGGAAVMDKWLGHAQDPDHWRDSMVEVRGCLATNLQSAFAQIWAHVTGEMLVGRAFHLTDEEQEEQRREGGEYISRHLCITSSPTTEDYPLRLTFWLSFRSARERIYLTNPYFVPERTIRDVLVQRARAGVDVRVLVPNHHNDVRLIRWASQSMYEEFLEAGVRIYEYQPTMIHQKLAVIDGVWSIVGTANLDVRSEELNEEVVLGILDKGFGRELEEAFAADLESAREVRLDEWRRRSRWRRLPERFFGLFTEQF